MTESMLANTNPDRPVSWDEFFRLVYALDLPADFIADCGDTPPEDRELFGPVDEPEGASSPGEAERSPKA
jgi:hypothetical protein